jgi:regulatory protein
MRQRSPYRRPDRVASGGLVVSAEPVSPRDKRILLHLDTGVEWPIERRAWAESGINIGDSVSVENIQRLFDAEDRVAATNSAARLLGMRSRSASELRKALEVRGYPDHIVREVINDFTERRYLDDAEFARRWITVRTEMAPRSNKMLGRELRARGVEPEIIEESLEDADLDDIETATRLASHRLDRMRGLPAEVQRRRIIGFLERRGFGWDTIGAVDRSLLRSLPSDDEAELELME